MVAIVVVGLDSGGKLYLRVSRWQGEFERPFNWDQGHVDIDILRYCFDASSGHVSSVCNVTGVRLRSRYGHLVLRTGKGQVTLDLAGTALPYSQSLVAPSWTMGASMFAIAAVRLRVDGERQVPDLKIFAGRDPVPEGIGIPHSDAFNLIKSDFIDPIGGDYSRARDYHSLLRVNEKWLYSLPSNMPTRSYGYGFEPQRKLAYVAPHLVRLQEFGLLIVDAQSPRYYLLHGREWESRSYVNFMLPTQGDFVNCVASRRFLDDLKRHQDLLVLVNEGEHRSYRLSKLILATDEPGGAIKPLSQAPSPHELALLRFRETGSEPWTGASSDMAFWCDVNDTVESFNELGCRCLGDTKPVQVMVTTTRYQLSPPVFLEDEIVRLAENAGVPRTWTPRPVSDFP